MTTKKDVTAQWLFKDYWGSPPEVEFSDEENLDYGKALIMAANGDGRLTEAEKEWILGYLTTGGHSEATLAELRSFDGAGDFESLFTRGVTRGGQRVCVFDAIRAAGSDGELAEEEIATVRRMASRIGVPDDVVDEFIGLYREEQDLKARRARAVFPTGVESELLSLRSPA